MKTTPEQADFVVSRINRLGDFAINAFQLLPLTPRAKALFVEKMGDHAESANFVEMANLQTVLDEISALGLSFSLMAE